MCVICIRTKHRVDIRPTTILYVDIVFQNGRPSPTKMADDSTSSAWPTRVKFNKVAYICLLAVSTVRRIEIS